MPVILVSSAFRGTESHIKDHILAQLIIGANLYKSEPKIFRVLLDLNLHHFLTSVLKFLLNFVVKLIS